MQDTCQPHGRPWDGHDFPAVCRIVRHVVETRPSPATGLRGFVLRRYDELQRDGHRGSQASVVERIAREVVQRRGGRPVGLDAVPTQFAARSTVVLG
jgi:hypothetical protein